MTLQEFITKNLPADWTKRTCLSGKRFADLNESRNAHEVLDECLKSSEGCLFIRVAALWIFGDRAQAAMYAAQKEALKRPWTWDTTQEWGKAFIDDVTAPCAELLRSRL